MLKEMQNFVALLVTKLESRGKRCKIHPRTGHEGPGGAVEIHLYSFFNLDAIWGGSTPRPGRFTPGKDPVPIL
jgi:hypothetical protein